MKKLILGSPEHLAEIEKHAAEMSKELFGSAKNTDADEVGVLSGNSELLYKSDADLYPNELEEYTPEERRKAFKVHLGK